AWSFAIAISGDGSVIVGSCINPICDDYCWYYYRGFRWTSGAGMVGIGTLAGDNQSSSNGISDDGQVTGGWSRFFESDFIGSYTAIRWNSSEGPVSLGTLPGDTDSSAIAVSGNGSVVVGHSSSFATGDRAFRWTSSAGLVSLGTLPGDMESS